ncbi:taste receptor, type 2, member 201, tandem duplicate 1 [Nerophis lumbriciformis]|uniref:taste receptor, type 2, member 201, tandem duplicate 1 n=1 Tax=Nerophis lumbriciformis TaxID=546530 RepID=UPI003BADB679
MMDVQLEISMTQFLIINAPLGVFILAMNLFFLFCLGCPQGTDRLKQPLRFLLELLIGSSSVYLVFLTLMMGNNKYWLVLFFMLQYSANISMSSYVWLSFCYFAHIVPARSAFFDWLKRNIKVTIFMVLLLDSLLYLHYCVVDIAKCLISKPAVFTDDDNVTWDQIPDNNGTLNQILDNRTWNQIPDKNVTWNQIPDSSQLKLYRFVVFIITRLHMLTSLCLMIFSNITTLRYLQGHMRTMTQNGISISRSRLQSWLRVCVTGICQCVIFFSCAVFILLDSLTLKYAPFYFGTNILSTVITLYIFGATVNLAVGQAVYRQRAAALWRALGSLCSVGTATDNLTSESADMANSGSVKR